MHLAPALLVVCVLPHFSCVTANEPVRAPEATPVQSAWVLDPVGAGETQPLPTSLGDALEEVLAQRNLKRQGPDPKALAQVFSATRATPQRLEHLAAKKGAAKTLLLIEAKATYYSQLNGYFRWVVGVKATVADPDRPLALLEKRMSVPVFLRFNHQREADAVVAASHHIKKGVGELLDAWLKGHEAKGDFSGRGASTSTSASPQQTDEGESAGPAPADHASDANDDLEGASPADDGPAPANPDPSGAPDSDDEDDLAHLPGYGEALPHDAIYLVMVDRFFNGDPTNDGEVDLADPQAFHGGDLLGLKKKFPT
jgi:hypothetical protein